jgi:hypothetical protein
MLGFPFFLRGINAGCFFGEASTETLPSIDGRKGSPNDKPPILLIASFLEIEFLFLPME